MIQALTERFYLVLSPGTHPHQQHHSFFTWSPPFQGGSQACKSVSVAPSPKTQVQFKITQITQRGEICVAPSMPIGMKIVPESPFTQKLTDISRKWPPEAALSAFPAQQQIENSSRGGSLGRRW